jgi:hypothetical protein
MATLVPEGTPDPDGERRFAERPFPLLEPVGWDGERHRGGYGIGGPGNITIALALVFGPWHSGGSAPRLSVSVGDRFVIDLARSDPDLLRMTMVGLAHRVGAKVVRLQDEAVPEIRHVLIEVDGRPVDFSVVRREHAWTAQGRWKGYGIELDGDNIEPESISLQIATEIPGPEFPSTG